MDNHSLLILEREYHFFHLKNDLETYPTDMIRRMDEKLLEIVENEPFKFKTVILKLILVHEYADVENYKKALEILEELESDMEQLKKSDCDDFLFKDVSLALFNVIRTCKAHVLISKNEEKKARKIIKKIVALEDLDNANKASVYGIRSMVFMEFGLCGHKMAYENAEKARKIDSKNPYWHFLIGKSLGRIRRVEKPFGIPSDEERDALKIAIEMNENYLFMLYTAESYVETSGRTFRFHNRNRSLYGHLKVSIDQMNEEASNLYKKCILKEPNCSHVLFRAARGFLNLPYPQRDPERAKNLLLKGLESNPRNPFANHLLAKYYERFDRNIPEAIKRLKICTDQQVFGAEMDLLRLQFSKDGVSAKPVEKLEKLLDVYTEAPRKIQILTQMASYYIFIDPDLPKACQLLKQAITTNCDDNILCHRSLFLRVRQPFSILDVLVDELKLQMEKDCSPENKKLYESFIFDLNDSNVSILKGRAKNLKFEIMKEDEQTRLGNYYKKERPPNTNMRRHSFQKPNSMSASQLKIEKARSVEQVDQFFDSWIDDDKKNENKSNGFSKTNNSKSSGSCSDVSPAASDSRFSRSSGRSNRNRTDNHSRNDNDQDAQFDRLSYASILRDGTSHSRFNQNRTTKNDNIADDFDRLSISSNQSGFSNVSRGRGRSSYSNSRPLQDRGDFNRNSQGRGPGRPFNSNDSRSNSNNSNASKFARGRGYGPRPSVERSNFDRTNTSNPRRNESNSENSLSRKSGFNESASNESRFKTADYPESTTSFDRKNNTSTSVRGEQNSESGSLKNWRQSSNKSADTEDRGNSRNKENTKAKPPSKSTQIEDSDSDDDLMSYFRKK